MTREQLTILTGPAYDGAPDGPRVWEVLTDAEGSPGEQTRAYAEAEWASVREALGIAPESDPTALIQDSGPGTSARRAPTLEEEQAAELNQLGAQWEAMST